MEFILLLIKDELKEKISNEAESQNLTLSQFCINKILETKDE